MSKTIGIVGFGSIGTRHAYNALELGCKIKVYDANPSVGRTVDTLDELLTTVDAVVIASPTAEHLAHMTSAVLLGKPALVEKPIADKWADAVDEVLAKATTPVMVGNNLRFHTCVKVAKGWLDEGLIGKIVHANFAILQKNGKPSYMRDGVILNWGAHEVDLALYLIGAGSVTHCTARTEGGHDYIADIILAHQNGASSTIRLDYVTEPHQRFFVISGTKGSISCDLEGFTAELNVDHSHSEVVACEGSFDQTYKDEMQAFIDRIDGKETLGASGQDGLACLELLLEARRLAGLS